MISNPVDVIENELKVLLNETKKKHSNIKEVLHFIFLIRFNILIFFEQLIYEATLRLNEYKSDQNSNKHLPIAEVLRPLKSLPETKNIKLILLGLGTFQKLLNNQIISSVFKYP